MVRPRPAGRLLERTHRKERADYRRLPAGRGRTIRRAYGHGNARRGAGSLAILPRVEKRVMTREEGLHDQRHIPAFDLGLVIQLPHLLFGHLAG